MISEGKLAYSELSFRYEKNFQDLVLQQRSAGDKTVRVGLAPTSDDAEQHDARAAKAARAERTLAGLARLVSAGAGQLSCRRKRV